jgi:hypothetical protein
MRIERVRIRRLAVGESAEVWGSALTNPAWLEGAEVLKREGAAWVRRGRLLGRDVVVKCRPLGTLGRRVKAALGLGHADRQWRGAALLGRAGVRTGAPLCAAWGLVDGVACELLGLEHVPGTTVLEVLDAAARGVGPGVREQHALAAAVAGTVVQMLGGGVCNKDHKPSNLIAVYGEWGEVAVIDCVGVRRARGAGVDGREAAEMLAALLIEPAGCGCPVRRALWMRGLRSLVPEPVRTGPREVRREWLLGRVKDVSAIVAAHGDPTPKVNPLGERRPDG